MMDKQSQIAFLQLQQRIAGLEHQIISYQLKEAHDALSKEAKGSNMSFDEIRDALAAQAADLTDAQKSELVTLIGGGAHTDSGGGPTTPPTGGTGPGHNPGG